MGFDTKMDWVTIGRNMALTWLHPYSPRWRLQCMLKCWNIFNIQCGQTPNSWNYSFILMFFFWFVTQFFTFQYLNYMTQTSSQIEMLKMCSVSAETLPLYLLNSDWRKRSCNSPTKTEVETSVIHIFNPLKTDLKKKRTGMGWIHALA
jgi:hypothetical protein